MNIPAGRRWLDVGCGTGALGAAILDHGSPLSVVGVEPSNGFLEKAKEQLGHRMTLRSGSAAAIPLEDGAVDVSVSGLVLNFVPDERAALGEMARVTIAGGTIEAYVWDQGPAPAYAMALDEPMRARLRDAIRGRIPLQTDGSISLTARAWAIRAAVSS